MRPAKKPPRFFSLFFLPGRWCPPCAFTVLPDLQSSPATPGVAQGGTTPAAVGRSLRSKLAGCRGHQGESPEPLFFFLGRCFLTSFVCHFWGGVGGVWGGGWGGLGGFGGGLGGFGGVWGGGLVAILVSFFLPVFF